MKKSGDWQPAVNGGTAVDAYKTQPVVFRNENLPQSQSAGEEEEYDKTYTKVEIESAFPGGDVSMAAVSKQEPDYPPDAVQKETSGG